MHSLPYSTNNLDMFLKNPHFGSKSGYFVPDRNRILGDFYIYKIQTFKYPHFELSTFSNIHIFKNLYDIKMPEFTLIIYAQGKILFWITLPLNSIIISTFWDIHILQHPNFIEIATFWKSGHFFPIKNPILDDFSV